MWRPISQGCKYLPHITVGVAKFDDVKIIEAGPFDAFDVHPTSISVYQCATTAPPANSSKPGR